MRYREIIFLCVSCWFSTGVFGLAPFLGIEDTFRDGAQERTISATAVAWVSGDFCADTFFPPGKVADYFGFQYLRDGDSCGMGHDSEFASRAANVLLNTLDETQREWLIEYAYEEVGIIGTSSIIDISFGSVDEIVYGRMPLQAAFREHLEGRTNLDKTKIEVYLSDMYLIDGLFTIGRARTFLKVLQSLGEQQKSFLDGLGCMTSWPEYDSQNFFDKTKHSDFIKVLYYTYAGQLLSWYKGHQIADAYFAPERVASYFGLFYLKDISSVITHNVTIDADATKDLGEALLDELTEAQREMIHDIVANQKEELYQYYELRFNMTLHLRSVFLNYDSQIDETLLLTLSKQIGKIDASISYLYATTFSIISSSLTSSQKERMRELRDLDEYPCSGSYYFSWNIQVPEISSCFISYFFDDQNTCSNSFYAVEPSPLTTATETPIQQYFHECSSREKETNDPNSIKIIIECNSEQTVYISYGTSPDSMSIDTGDIEIKTNDKGVIKNGYTLEVVPLRCGNVEYYYVLKESSTSLPSEEVRYFTVSNECLTVSPTLAASVAPSSSPTLAASTIPSSSPTLSASVTTENPTIQQTFDECTTREKEAENQNSIQIIIECVSEQTVYISYGTSSDNMDTDTSDIEIMTNNKGFIKKGYTLEVVPLDCGTVEYYYVLKQSSTSLPSEEINYFTVSNECLTVSPTLAASDKTVSPSVEKACSASVSKIKVSVAILSVICNTKTNAKIKYGMSKNLVSSTERISFEPDLIQEVKLTDLEPSTVYYYAVVYSKQQSSLGNFTTGKMNATYWWPCNPKPPNIVLFRPTNESVSAVVRSLHNVTVSIVYGLQKESLSLSTNTFIIPGNKSQLIKLTGLKSNSLYSYRMKYQYNVSCPVQEGATHFFKTKCQRNESFNFVVTSDTHWHDAGWEPLTFEQSLENILIDAENDIADFLLELGDTFMGEKLGLDETSIHKPYESLFNYYSATCHSVPLYLVTGNHEGENGWEIIDENSMPISVALARKAYFANPEPNFFYSGNKDIQFEKLGLLGDYYSWEWGNALFITLDPFWYTDIKPNTAGCRKNPGWCFTLGYKQYSWLYETLSNSDSRFKYIFVHNLLGGIFGNITDRPYTGAGDAEWSKYFEWGGYDEDGTWAFDRFRPGWLNISIHEMLQENNVTIVFRGHDHFYGLSVRDGIIYQTVPRPSFATSASLALASKRGYDPNTVLVDGGYLNVHVSESCTNVSFKTFEGSLVTEYDKCI